MAPFKRKGKGKGRPGTVRDGVPGTALVTAPSAAAMLTADEGAAAKAKL